MYVEYRNMTTEKILASCDGCGTVYPAHQSDESIQPIGIDACTCGEEAFTEFNIEDGQTGV